MCNKKSEYAKSERPKVKCKFAKNTCNYNGGNADNCQISNIDIAEKIIWPHDFAIPPTFLISDLFLKF